MPDCRFTLCQAICACTVLAASAVGAQDRPMVVPAVTVGAAHTAEAPGITAPGTPAPGTGTVVTGTPAGEAQPDPVTVSDEVVDGIAVRRARGETVIHAPMELVVRRMMDFGRYPDFMPHVEESRVVHRNRALTDLYIRVPLTPALGVIWSLLRLETHRTADRVEITGQSVDGNMDHFEIQTVIERVPGNEPLTRFTFAVLAQPRLPFPAVVFSRENRDAAHTVAGNLRGLVERSYALGGMAPASAAGVPQVPPNAASQR